MDILQVPEEAGINVGYTVPGMRMDVHDHDGYSLTFSGIPTILDMIAWFRNLITGHATPEGIV
jgi:hypothetical protein